MAFSTDDTIVGIATPEGRGGIGVVRVSGPAAADVVGRLIDRAAPLEPRYATFVRVVSRDGSGGPPRVVDTVVATWFAAPHSYTGEDVIELGAHGSPVVLRQIVALALSGGARLAEPGEFTFRAYLHGRIDLVQAEAVADLVDAVTPAQARAAMDQLDGTLTGEIGRVDRLLFDLAARLEASLDFPDEGFHFITRAEAGGDMTAIAQALDALLSDGRRGRLIREGRTVVILGPPNAGKSSLFNALAGAPRAIVTAVPGTTRDIITERIEIEGLPVTLVDTAGLRETVDVVEAEGVRRARQARDVAALAVVVVDGSVEPGAFEHAVLSDVRPPRLVVLNKSDLGRGELSVYDAALQAAEVVRVSATTGAGLDVLRSRIRETLGLDDRPRETPAITNLRHLTLVQTARDLVARAEAAVEAGATEEIVLAELAGARQALEEITGRRSADDLLRHIFSRFCVGK